MLARTIRYIVISHNILMQLEYATMFFETMMHLRFERFVWIFRMINFPWARSNSKQCSCFDFAFFCNMNMRNCRFAIAFLVSPIVAMGCLWIVLSLDGSLLCFTCSIHVCLLFPSHSRTVCFLRSSAWRSLPWCPCEPR